MLRGFFLKWFKFKFIELSKSVHLGTHYRVIANQPAGWCGNPFSLSPIGRHGPMGRLCAEGTRKPSACRGMRIATPVCALARNDMH